MGGRRVHHGLSSDYEISGRSALEESLAFLNGIGLPTVDPDHRAANGDRLAGTRANCTPPLTRNRDEDARVAGSGTVRAPHRACARRSTTAVRATRAPSCNFATAGLLAARPSGASLSALAIEARRGGSGSCPRYRYGFASHNRSHLTNPHRHRARRYVVGSTSCWPAMMRSGFESSSWFTAKMPSQPLSTPCASAISKRVSPGTTV